MRNAKLTGSFGYKQGLGLRGLVLPHKQGVVGILGVIALPGDIKSMYPKL